MAIRMGKYFCEYCPGHPRATKEGYVYSHVLVAENEILKRKLKDEECVHHIDEDKLNNDSSNLMIFATKADHTSFHHGNKAYKDGDVYRTVRTKHVCKECGCECSSKAMLCKICYKKTIRCNKPSKNKLCNELYKIYIGEESFCSVGRKYKVTNAAIKKWCDSYELPRTKKDIIKYFEDMVVNM